jgi:hypothetical protein
MAEIKGMDIHKGKIEMKLCMNRNEYMILQHNTSNILVLPTGKEILSHLLTTGKLGNSNRIMLPKKLLTQYNIKCVDKKVPSSIFMVDDNAFLLIKLKRSGFGIPTFRGDENESNDGYKKT